MLSRVKIRLFYLESFPMEKLYYGIMILFVAIGVLLSPFAYMRSLRFLDRHFKNKHFRQKADENNFRQPENSDNGEKEN